MPPGVHVKKSAPSTARTSGVTARVRRSTSLIHAPRAESRCTKAIASRPGARCSDRPMSRATISPRAPGVRVSAICSVGGEPSTNSATLRPSPQAW